MCLVRLPTSVLKLAVSSLIRGMVGMVERFHNVCLILPMMPCIASFGPVRIFLVVSLCIT